ncbi:MAG: C69 family dipeptidase [Myxococcota bacterium]
MKTLLALVSLAVALRSCPVLACTNFLVTKGASADGSTMITYAADSHELYGELYFFPAAKHPPGAKREIIEWDTGKRLGEIDEAPVTYSVIGNMNEHQVAIGETTWGGRKELENPDGVVDYGSLMYLALQRAKTAREAIQVIVSLTEQYGYASSGESFSIADPNEAWLFEMIGKGPGQKGVLWVARKVPDGYISGHANAARIRQFPLNSPTDTLYAKDVISFARAKGWFTGKDADFSFADTYNPADFGARRFCDARVWCMFERTAPKANAKVDAVLGTDPKAAPIPLWVKPEKKVSVADVMGLMRDHYEGTPLDMTKDVGAGPYGLPYRWRPLTWKAGEKEFFNERATSTQQTGFSFVAQSRGWLPGPIGGVLWFGVDDTASTVYFPVYAGSTEVPKPFAVGTGDFHHVTWDSAFWVFNQVSNYAYLRWSEMHPEVQKVQAELEGRFLAAQAEVDQAALALFKQSPRLARDYLTRYSVQAGEDVVARWRELSKFLLYKFMDGNVKDAQGKVTHPGYPKDWYAAVAQATGEKLRTAKTPYEEQREREEKAKAKATAESVLKLLDARGLTTDAKQREAVLAMDDVKKLEGLLVKAATAKSAAEVLDAR